MDKKLIAIAAVAILIIAGVGIALATSDDDKEKPVVVTNRLVVYGNANNDDYIDDRDMSMVKDLADGNASWDRSANPFADVNADGRIDSKDVDLLQKMIDKTPCRVYYLDYQNEAVQVDYPLDRPIGTMYYQQAQLAIMLGLWDDVTACGYKGLNETANPGYTDKINFGNGYDVSPEAVLESGIKTIICYTQTDTTAPDLKKMVRNTGADVNVLCINHEHLLKCVVSYAYLFDVTEKVRDYIELADECNESVVDSMTPVAKEDQPSVALVMLYGSASTDKIRVLGYNPAGNTHNLAKLFNGVPNVNWVRADLEKPAYGTYVTSEWFMKNQPDYIVVVGSGIGTTDDMNLKQVQDVYYKKCKEVFGQTEAFKNGNIVCTSNGIMNGYSNPLVSMNLLSLVYEQIDKDLAAQAYDSWYDDYVLHKLEDRPADAMFKVGA